MYQSFYSPDDKMINNFDYNSLQQTEKTFRAFVDAIIPRTPELAEIFGKVQYFGALDLYTDEYIILSLDNYYIPIAKPTAEMLEIAAEQMASNTFAKLEPSYQLYALTLLEQNAIYLQDLPIPFQDNPGYVLYITSALNRFVLMGYYSEWSGYGSTRLETPDHRKLEYFPLSWKQVGYPGPSLGYRALRVSNSK